MKYCRYTVGMCLVVGLIGCGGKTQPVTGTILFKETGKPATELVDYLVSAQHIEQPVGATGLVRADGTFTLGTYADGDGAILGKYKVVITPPVQMDPDKPAIRSILDARFAEFDKSGLEINVQSGRNTVQLTVEKKKKK